MTAGHRRTTGDPRCCAPTRCDVVASLVSVHPTSLLLPRRHSCLWALRESTRHRDWKTRKPPNLQPRQRRRPPLQAQEVPRRNDRTLEGTARTGSAALKRGFHPRTDHEVRQLLLMNREQGDARGSRHRPEMRAMSGDAISGISHLSASAPPLPNLTNHPRPLSHNCHIPSRLPTANQNGHVPRGGDGGDVVQRRISGFRLSCGGDAYAGAFR